MKFSPVRIPLNLLVASLSLVVAGLPDGWAAERPPVDLEAGRRAFAQHCARCHGEQGKGDGVDAKRFYPRPRDLSMGRYKFRSTESGTPPVDEDLFLTVTQGLPGSNMPDWQHLDEATRWQLVEYMKTLSPVFQDTQPVPVSLGADPGPQGASPEKGKAVYEQLGCAACHGVQGRANGTSAAGLVDEWGMAIRPADLTQGWAYRGSSDPRAIALRVLSGIDGSGMPSYAGAAAPEDVWQMAYYVHSLQEPPHWNMIAHAQPVDGALPSSPDDARWALAERTDVRLRNTVTPTGEWAAAPTVQAVSLQTVYNSDGIAFYLAWNDPTQDAGESSDRLAMVLKPTGAQGDVVSLHAWPYTGAPLLDVCAWSASTQQASERLAQDFDRALESPDGEAKLNSVAAYGDGRWHLVIQRAFAPAAPEGAAVVAEQTFTPIAFAVWDGGNAGARAVSPWIDIALRKMDTPATH